jgi:3-phenylpropionate/trans-cinnamate dioxygenase ferredoxin component
MSGLVRVCSVGELPAQGSARRVDVDGLCVALIATEGALFAIDDTCSHDEVSLSDGEIAGHTVECWLHGSTFDVRSGAALCLPARKSVAVFGITVDGDDVYLNASPATPLAPATADAASLTPNASTTRLESNA